MIKNNECKVEITTRNKKYYNCPFTLPSNRELRESVMFEKYGHTYSFHDESMAIHIHFMLNV
jgi:hypothetical protein